MADSSLADAAVLRLTPHLWCKECLAEDATIYRPNPTSNFLFQQKFPLYVCNFRAVAGLITIRFSHFPTEADQLTELTLNQPRSPTLILPAQS
jgi:hypothetical protein